MGDEKLNPKYTEQLMEDSIIHNNELKISDERIKYLDKMIKKTPKKINRYNKSIKNVIYNKKKLF